MRSYESKALEILVEHGGELVAAFELLSSARDKAPDEIHLLQFPSRDAFERYRSDPRHNSLSVERAESVLSTDLYESKSLINYPLNDRTDLKDQN